MQQLAVCVENLSDIIQWLYAGTEGVRTKDLRTRRRS